jgi:hypothetical protein
MIRPYSEPTHIETVKSKTGRAFDIYRGYDDRIVSQLVSKSTEPAIMERCPKDAGSRFASEATFANWVSKNGGRFLYPLVEQETDELAGVIWMGPEKFDRTKYPEKPSSSSLYLHVGGLMSDTYAIRVYENTQERDDQGNITGSGLAKPYTRVAIGDYATMRMLEGPENLPNFTGLHLETDLDNMAARRTYEDLNGEDRGFVPVAENSESNRIAMILPATMLDMVLGENYGA